MHAVRLSQKGTVPGQEKLRETRRFVKATRQRAARGSLLRGLRTFLTADSFMYGPLLEESSPPALAAHHQHHLSDDESEPHTPDDGSSRDNTTNGREGETSSGKNVDENGHDATPRRYQGSRSATTILSVQRTTRSGRTVVPPADGSGRTPTSTARAMHEPTPRADGPPSSPK